MSGKRAATLKQRTKQVVRRAVGEPYVGKRLKMRSIGTYLDGAQLSPTSVLDAGAEDATFVYWLADRYPCATVMATDIDEAAIGACIAARPRDYAERVSFRVGDFSGLPCNTYDLITAFDVLEHIGDDRAAVRSLFSSMRPGGTLLVHVPRDQWTHADGRVEHVADEDAWRINSGHVRMGYSPESMRRLLESAGFEVRDTQLWLRRWGVRAHAFYARLERFVPLRLVSVPFTDLAWRLDHNRPEREGNTVWAHALKPL